MVDIENELFSIIADALHEKYPDPDEDTNGIFVTGEYVKTPSSFPAVSVVEMDNTTEDWDSSGETHARVMYEVNVYSNLRNGKKSQCKAIAKIIDHIFTSYNFARMMLQPVPNMNDSTIYRMVGRYRAKVGNNKVIYRG